MSERDAEILELQVKSWNDDESSEDRDSEVTKDAQEWVLDCGYEGCCMPGYHFRSECHNAEDMEAYYREQEDT